ALNDKIIPVEQGGSLRLIVPQKYAYKSVKWLNELRLLFKRPFGFWEKKGYPFKDQ
ncbi:MAG: sulfite oxidase-like oxidoreductase, partial [Actinobacteria bacterium]